MPAVLLLSPKFESNVADVKRAVACFEAGPLFLIGRRYTPATGAKGDRIPRPLRMERYNGVQVHDHADFPPIGWDNTVVVEKLEWATPLPDFKHPKNATYIFGPEDGSVPKWIREKARYRTFIPGIECLNLATSVSIVLYDRSAKEKK